jgi:hypothetical protein
MQRFSYEAKRFGGAELELAAWGVEATQFGMGTGICAVLFSAHANTPLNRHTPSDACPNFKSPHPVYSLLPVLCRSWLEVPSGMDRTLHTLHCPSPQERLQPTCYSSRDGRGRGPRGIITDCNLTKKTGLVWVATSVVMRQNRGGRSS